KDITLEGLAAHMSMSIATLKRRLAADDLSFSQILKVKRINFAATQLRKSEKSITEIAFESGFKSAAHFSTAFKSV
ncbi:helix-turn-helix transcriptional regulator, partial [Vibrio parahaemolyticus]|nr:helix-turn-helix transcriptional regulator [Vibrio parahaemolyticus]